jgi:hypothetical protein
LAVRGDPSKLDARKAISAACRSPLAVRKKTSMRGDMSPHSRAFTAAICEQPSGEPGSAGTDTVVEPVCRGGVSRIETTL